MLESGCTTALTAPNRRSKRTPGNRGSAPNEQMRSTMAMAAVGAIRDGIGAKTGPRKAMFWVNEKKLGVEQRALLDRSHQHREKVWVTNSSYVGDWKDDLRDGFGVQIWSNGSRYEGEPSTRDVSGFRSTTRAIHEAVPDRRRMATRLSPWLR